MSFRPNPNDELTIGDQIYHITEHPAAPGMAYGQTGRRGTVYQLIDEGGIAWALKVFQRKYREPRLVGQAERIQQYASLQGLSVCDRKVFTSTQYVELIRGHMDLAYAVLMPWIHGMTWQEMVLQRERLSSQEALDLVREFIQALVRMEERGLAHCDLSGPNLIVTPEDEVELVDIEELYGSDLMKPNMLPGGSPGYAHKTAPEGLWREEADRFAGAVLIAEMLGWVDERVQEEACDEGYFSPSEMQTNCERFHLLMEILEERWGKKVADLFEVAWFSDALALCPTFTEWLAILPEEVPEQVPEVDQAAEGEASKDVGLLIFRAERAAEGGEIEQAISFLAQAETMASGELLEGVRERISELERKKDQEQESSEHKTWTCPECKKEVDLEYELCPHCEVGRQFVQEDRPDGDVEATNKEEPKWVKLISPPESQLEDERVQKGPADIAQIEDRKPIFSRVVPKDVRIWAAVAVIVLLGIGWIGGVFGPRENPSQAAIESRSVPTSESTNTVVSSASTVTPEIEMTDLPTESTYLLVPTASAEQFSKEYSVIYLGINVSEPPFDDVLVRKAFAAAFDRASFAEYITEHYPEREYIPATNFTPAEILGVDLYGSVGFEYDPEKAQELLEEAGYPGGVGFPPITLAYSSEKWLNNATFMSQSWEEALGIKVELSQFDYSKIATSHIHLFYLGWTADYLDPYNFLRNGFCSSYSEEFYTSGELAFWADEIHQEEDQDSRRSLILEFTELACPGDWSPRLGWSSLDYEDLIQRALDETDVSQQRDLYVQAETILVETEVFVIPLIHSWLVTDTVSVNQTPTPIGPIPTIPSDMEWNLTLYDDFESSDSLNSFKWWVEGTDYQIAEGAAIYEASKGEESSTRVHLGATDSWAPASSGDIRFSVESKIRVDPSISAYSGEGSAGFQFVGPEIPPDGTWGFEIVTLFDSGSMAYKCTGFEWPGSSYYERIFGNPDFGEWHTLKVSIIEIPDSDDLAIAAMVDDEEVCYTIPPTEWQVGIDRGETVTFFLSTDWDGPWDFDQPLKTYFDDVMVGPIGDW